jgi:hypothetical protein
MEQQEHMHNHDNSKMCDWCGNRNGMRYSWLRLVLALLIGLFIFFAGIEIGQLRAAVYGAPGSNMFMHHRYESFDGMMMPGQDDSTTTLLVPSQSATPTAAPATKPAAVKPAPAATTTIITTQ